MSALRTCRANRALPRQPRGSWLALFAMLMIFIGPLISQSMPMEHHASMPMPAAQHSGMLSMDHASHGDRHAAHAASQDAAAMDHALWAKCGYCTLLFGCPALPQMLSLVLATPPKPADYYAALTRDGHARRTVFLHALSRAPPLLMLS